MAKTAQGLARRPLPADPERRGEGAEGRPQGRRAGLGRGDRATRSARLVDRRRAPERDPRLGRRHHRVGRAARGGVERDHHRLQRAARAEGRGARRARRRRHPALHDHLRGPERRARRARGPARADARRRRSLGRAEVRQMFTVSRRRARSRAASSPTARSCAARRRGCCATTSSCTTGKIGTPASASRTTCARSRAGYECGIGLENYQDVKVGRRHRGVRGRAGRAPAAARAGRGRRRRPSARPEAGASRPMVVGVLRLELLLPENHSLKGKRSVLRADQGARAATSSTCRSPSATSTTSGSARSSA